MNDQEQSSFLQRRDSSLSFIILTTVENSSFLAVALLSTSPALWESVTRIQDFHCWTYAHFIIGWES